MHLLLLGVPELVQRLQQEACSATCYDWRLTWGRPHEALPQGQRFGTQLHRDLPGAEH